MNEEPSIGSRYRRNDGMEIEVVNVLKRGSNPLVVYKHGKKGQETTATMHVDYLRKHYRVVEEAPLAKEKA